MMLTVALLLAAPAARPFTPEEMLRVRRLDDVQVAPDGKRAAVTVREKRLDDNRDARDVWLVELPGARRTPSPATGTATIRASRRTARSSWCRPTAAAASRSSGSTISRRAAIPSG